MYIYAIASGPESIKIGYSLDPERRVGQLQTGHERLLKLVHKEAVSAEKAPILERLIHQANRHKCLHGEWFKLTHEDAIREIQFAVIRYCDD